MTNDTKAQFLFTILNGLYDNTNTFNSNSHLDGQIYLQCLRLLRKYEFGAFAGPTGLFIGDDVGPVGFTVVGVALP